MNQQKTFDELKNKLGEKKSWATSATAKSNQAVLLCVTHNLLTLLDRKIEVESGVVNVGEVERKEAMLKSRKEVMLAKGKVLPKVAGYMQRLTVRTVKFIRWVRTISILQPRGRKPWPISPVSTRGYEPDFWTPLKF
jgi:hypothetical protein